MAFWLPKWLGAEHGCKRVHDAVQEGLACALWPCSPVWLCTEHASKQVQNAGRVSHSGFYCELAMLSACQQAGGGVQGEAVPCILWPVWALTCLHTFELAVCLSWPCVVHSSMRMHGMPVCGIGRQQDGPTCSLKMSCSCLWQLLA